MQKAVATLSILSLAHVCAASGNHGPEGHGPHGAHQTGPQQIQPFGIPPMPPPPQQPYPQPYPPQQYPQQYPQPPPPQYRPQQQAWPQQGGTHTHDDGTTHAGPMHSGGHPQQHHQQPTYMDPSLVQQWDQQCRQMQMQQSFGQQGFNQCMQWHWEQWNHQQQEQGSHTHDDGTVHSGHSAQDRHDQSTMNQWHQECQQLIQQQFGRFDQQGFNQCMQWQASRQQQQGTHTHGDGTVHGGHSPQDQHSNSGSVNPSLASQWQRECQQMINQQFGYLDQQGMNQCMQWQQQQYQSQLGGSHTHDDGTVHNGHSDQQQHNQGYQLTNQWQNECQQLITQQLGYVDPGAFDNCMRWKHQQQSNQGYHSHSDGSTHGPHS